MNQDPTHSCSMVASSRPQDSSTLICAGGGGASAGSNAAAQNQQGPPPKWHSYKVLVDPAIHRGAPKIVRYDGHYVPGDPLHISPSLSDPRNKLPIALWKRLEPMELPVPKFKVDEHYVGEPPKVEVTIENLNDNVDGHFLHQMVIKFGPYEELTIHHHPITRRHLGLARLVFEEVRAAKECIKHLHQKSVMGKQLNCYIDPRGTACKQMYLELTQEQPPLQNLAAPSVSSAVSTSAPAPSTASNDTASTPNAAAATTTSTALTAALPGKPGRHKSMDDSSDEALVSNSSHHDRQMQSFPVDTYHGSSKRRHSSGGSRQDRPPADSRWEQQRGRDRRHEADSQISKDSDPHSHDPIKYKAAGSLQQPFDMAYWQKAALEYAQLQSHIPSADEKDNESVTEPSDSQQDQNDGIDHQVDLDTRLKMLMKDKTGAMPAFLRQELSSGSETDHEVEAATLSGPLLSSVSCPTEEEKPLSRAPSPFLSEQHYLDNFARKLKKSRQSALKNGRPVSRNSDKMSLSSLSSVENNILSGTQQPDMYSYTCYYPGQDPSMPGYSSWQAIYPDQSSYAGDFNTSFPGFMPTHAHYAGWTSSAWTGPQDPYSVYNLLRQKSDRNAFRPLISKTVDKFVDELRIALQKDIRKKMCETYAFFLFQKWWAEQERKSKEKEARLTDKKEEAKEPHKVEPPKATTDLSTLFDKERENMETKTSTFGAAGSLGLGFRGTIPKLPSFKRKPNNETTAASHRKNRSSRSRHVGHDDSSSGDQDSNDRSKRKVTSERRRQHEERREKRFERERVNEKQDITKKNADKKEPNVSKTATSRSSQHPDNEPSSIKTAVSIPVKPSAVPTKNHRRPRSCSASSQSSSRSSSPDSSSSLSVASTKSNRDNEDEECLPNKTKVVKTKIDHKKKSSSSSSSNKDKSNSDSDSGSSSGSSSASSTSSSSSASSDDELSENEPVKRSVTPKLSAQAKKATLIESKTIPDALVNGSLAKVESSPAHISDHCYARPVDFPASAIHEDDNKENSSLQMFESQFANDHGYTRPNLCKAVAVPAKSSVLKSKTAHRSVAPAISSKQTQPFVFSERSSREEFDILYRFLTQGLDLEDIRFFRISYHMLLKREEMAKMLNYTHWVDHPVTDLPEPPPVKKRRRGTGAADQDFSRPHLTGSCRTEGYYKMDPREKRRTKYHLQRPEAYEAFTQQFQIASIEGAVTKARFQTSQSQSREARSVQRRQLAVLGEEALNSDLLKFNQLKFRRKQLAFGKSAIHDWGLFAREDIGADEMVIEYVGHVIRPLIADVREKRYEKQGIGSSYLFRIDQDYVVDATKCGNLARFINHSCDPNCYAKIITIDGEKKIVIYSKQPIAFGEEITYDYKFPIEDEKILCLCGAKNCRKYLN